MHALPEAEMTPFPTKKIKHFTSFFYIYFLIVVWSEENSKSNIFLSGCANENFKENGENPFLFL